MKHKSLCITVPVGLFLIVFNAGCFQTGFFGPRTFHASHRTIDYTLCSAIGASSKSTDETDDPIGDRKSNRPRVEIVQGNPNAVIDGIGWAIGIPRKLALWDRRVDNHDVQPETMAEVATFATVNELDGVCIRINQYAPLAEWKRLGENKRVGAGWRYTMGTLSLIGYTVLPGRIVGGDNYNPYTNSVYVYSDVPALAMEAAAYARDIQQRKLPGTYAAVNQLPLISVWHETINTQDTLAYLESHGTADDQKEGLAILYPNYGASVAGAVGSVFGTTGLLEIGGAMLGHMSSWHKMAQLDSEDYSTVSLDHQCHRWPLSDVSMGLPRLLLVQQD